MSKIPVILSVNVGLVQIVHWNDQLVSTGIYKTPVQHDEKIDVKKWNLAGDRQADLTVHGGKDKAVYVYCAEHYDYWKTQIGPHSELESYGAFGENLTIANLLEDDVYIGDVFQAGSTEFIVTQPRIPCFKLNLKFSRNDMVALFSKSSRVGFYLTISKEGSIKTGDVFKRINRQPASISIKELYKLFTTKTRDSKKIEQLLSIPHLADAWRAPLRKMLKKS